MHGYFSLLCGKSKANTTLFAQKYVFQVRKKFWNLTLNEKKLFGALVPLVLQLWEQSFYLLSIQERNVTSSDKMQENLLRLVPNISHKINDFVFLNVWWISAAFQNVEQHIQWNF